MQILIFVTYILRWSPTTLETGSSTSQYPELRYIGQAAATGLHLTSRSVALTDPSVHQKVLPEVYERDKYALCLLLCDSLAEGVISLFYI
jgi:hypothetical protein